MDGNLGNGDAGMRGWEDGDVVLLPEVSVSWGWLWRQYWNAGGGSCWVCCGVRQS